MVSPLSLVVFHLMHLAKRVNYGTGINIFADYIFCVCVTLYQKGGPGASGRVLPPVTGRSRVRVAVSSHCIGEGKACH